MTNFSRIPNDIIDNAKLNPYQFQVFSIIVRKTDGWCKTTDGISLSQFLKLVTFKKPKLISTLKELEKMRLITIIHTTSKSGGKSYNIYSISKEIVAKYNKEVVTEDYYPSNQELLPLVTEDYIQKKLITKETNTYIPISTKINTKPTKKDIELVENSKVETKIGRSILYDFLAYRRLIKKPIKTVKGLNDFISNLNSIVKAKYNLYEVIELMESKEWQTVKLEWVQKELNPKQTTSSGNQVKSSKRVIDGFTY